MDEEEKEDERATYRTALETLERKLPEPTDPYDGVVSRFGQLPPHTRLFLQKLSTRDVRTLARSILNIQRAGNFVIWTRRIVVWSLGALAAGALAGENISKLAGRIGELLW
jgi:hypothetical protein